MPTKRIDDAWEQPQQCKDPDHFPPRMMVFKPGTYEHTCPTCDHITVFTIPEKYL